MKVFAYIMSVLGLSVLVVLLLVLFYPDRSSANIVPTSPLPDFLSMVKNKQVRFLDLWLPQIESFDRDTKLPETTAKSVLMYDLSSEKALYERNARQRIPMASLTKIMTAIVALENKKENGFYRARGEHLVGEDSMGITPNEEFTLEELLYGLMLNSGNDASEVIAGNYPGGRVEFLRAMDSKALTLGIKDTKFSNPSGLQGDGEQYTTAYDLLVITRYAIEHFPELVKITSTYEKTLPANQYHKEYYLTNETNLVSTYPGVRGFKTGYTPEAGMCLVTYFENGDKRLIGIIMNSENRREEMKNLLDYSLTKLGITPPEYTPRS